MPGPFGCAMQLAERLIEEVWNRGDMGVVDELVDDEYISHSSGAQGSEGYKKFFADLRRADIHFTMEDKIAEGDTVVVRWTARGTHQGEYQGIPPTGRAGVITGIEVARFADGKKVESWGEFDRLGIMQQLGVIPPPQEQQA